MADAKDLVKTVVQVLHDGVKGFADFSEHFKDAQLKAYFLKESETRATFARELEAIPGFESEVGGTAAGAVHRVWGDLKANLGGSDHTLLETSEQGEDAAKKVYKDALADLTVTGPVRQLLERQQIHINSSHDQVRAFRDSGKY